MREDISGGLKNAIGKGETLEQAIISFINAGYSENEVRESAGNVHGGILNSLQNVKSLEAKEKKRTIQKLETHKIIKNNKNHSKSKISGKIVLLGGALLILTGILISTLLFKDQILNFFNERF